MGLSDRRFERLEVLAERLRERRFRAATLTSRAGCTITAPTHPHHTRTRTRKRKLPGDRERDRLGEGEDVRRRFFGSRSLESLLRLRSFDVCRSRLLDAERSDLRSEWEGNGERDRERKGEGDGGRDSGGTVIVIDNSSSSSISLAGKRDDIYFLRAPKTSNSSSALTVEHHIPVLRAFPF